MSVSIDTVTIGGIEDRRLVLANAQAARVIDIGTNWTRIRIGIRGALNDSGASIAGTPRIYIGMLSSPSAGLANGPLTGSTSHFVGLVQGSATLTRNASPLAYSGVWANGSYAKKVGATITAIGGGNVTGWLSANPSTYRNIVAAEILKGSPNFTINIIAPNLSTVHDVSLANFISAMEVSTITAMGTYLNGIYGGIYNSSSLSGSLAVSEATNGFLDAVCVAWDKNSPVLNISDVIWAKMA